MRKIQIVTLSMGIALGAAPAFAQDTGGAGTPPSPSDTGTDKTGTGSQGQGAQGQGAQGPGAQAPGAQAPGAQGPGSTMGQGTQGAQGTQGTEGSTGAKGGNLSEQDQRFIESAATDNMLQVRLGELAQRKSQNKDVKDLASKLVKDHNKATDDLRKIADQGGFTLPQQLTSSQQQVYDRLSALEGREFDHAFLKDVAQQHSTAISEFQSESRTGQSPDLKKFAHDEIKTLQKHYDIATRDARKM